MKTRILLVDDHQIVCEGLRGVLEKHPEFEVVGEAANGREAVERAEELRPHLIIMDITMPELNGVEATRLITAAGKGTRVIALSMHSNRKLMHEIIKAGATGYLLKESAVAELLDAIRVVMAGNSYLSPRVTETVLEGFLRRDPGQEGRAFSTLSGREREVLQLIAEGRTTKEMAARLFVSIKTIEAHRARIMDKLGIDSIAGLTKFAVNEGLTSPEP